MRRRGLYSGLKRFLKCFARADRGADLAEYALILAVIVTLATISIARYSCELGCVFEQIAVAFEKERGNIPPGQVKKCTKPCQ